MEPTVGFTTGPTWMVSRLCLCRAQPGSKKLPRLGALKQTLNQISQFQAPPAPLQPSILPRGLKCQEHQSQSSHHPLSQNSGQGRQGDWPGTLVRLVQGCVIDTTSLLTHELRQFTNPNIRPAYLAAHDYQRPREKPPGPPIRAALRTPALVQERFLHAGLISWASDNQKKGTILLNWIPNYHVNLLLILRL